MADSGQQHAITPALLVGGAALWGARTYWGLLETELFWLPALLAAIAGICALRLLDGMSVYALRYVERRKVSVASDRAGSSHFATVPILRRAGMFKPRGLFLGMVAGRAVFSDFETHGMILGSAGSAKTISFTIPALCHSPMSMIVPDFKRTLYPMTHKLRAKRHGHRVICLDPLNPTDSYNPLQGMLDSWASGHHQDLVAEAQAKARQLHPDPPTQGENQFFRQGSRKLISFCLLYLVIIGGPLRANLCEALRLLRDKQRLLDALELASRSDALDGELSDIAKDLHAKFATSDVRQAESFREGAVQSLEVFSPSGPLAAIIKTTTFRFSEMKEEPITLYICPDPTRMKELAQWVGLITSDALNEFKRCRNTAPVLLLCEEATNFVVDGLISSLTELREFGVRCFFVIQELEEVSRAYGKEALATLLSQTEIKIFSGSQSETTNELVSRMMGETTTKSDSYNFGRKFTDQIQQSISEAARRLMTADEVRRSGRSILFIRNLPPILADKVGYHEVKPWSNWVEINPLHGRKFAGRTKLRIRY